MGDAFLKKHGFAGVNLSKGFFLSYTYPLHTAVEKRDSEMVQLLLRAKADRNLRDAHGRTPRVLAKKLNKNRLHMSIIRALTFQRRPGTALAKPEKCDAATQMTPVAHAENVSAPRFTP